MKCLSILLISLTIISLIFISTHSTYRILKKPKQGKQDVILKFTPTLLYISSKRLKYYKNYKSYLNKTIIAKIDSTNNTCYYSREWVYRD